MRTASNSRSPAPSHTCRLSEWERWRSLLRVTLPDIFERQWIRLSLDRPVAVTGVFRKHKLVRIPFGRQNLRHVLVGKDPVVIVVAGDEVVAVADMHPDAQRFFRTVGNQGL